MDPSASSSSSSSSTGGGGGDAAGDAGAPIVASWIGDISQSYQHLLDKSTLHVRRRWLGLALLALIYIARVAILQGFYLVTYALAIYALGKFIAFITPQADPAGIADGTALPTRSTDEFRPFVPLLPEFKFWYSITKAFCIALTLTFFDVFDVPVFWPILVVYFFGIFAITMKGRIRHMMTYKYLPFSTGKQHYGKKPASTEDETIPMT